MFRLGELHITFAMLKVIARYIGYSGIYRLYIEVGLYVNIQELGKSFMINISKGT